MLVCDKHEIPKIWRGNRWRCRECQIAAQKRNYLKNHQREINKRRVLSDKRKSEQYAKVIEIKNVPCTDCGNRFPHYVMHFDHTKDDKAFNVSRMFGFSWSKILEEIEKCEIVCSNCHAVRTWNRQH